VNQAALTHEMTDVIVIGGGVTGCGVAWDLSLRGLRVTLVERRGLASGSSGRFHGLVHSGARYAVSDPIAAAQCARESRVLARIAPRLVRGTGGLFALLVDDDAGYVQQWEDAAHETGVSVRQITIAEALRREPLLAASVRRAYVVRDAVCEGPALCAALAEAARSSGAVVRDYHRVEDFICDGRRIDGVRVTDVRTGEALQLRSRLVILAAGPWCSEILSRVDLKLKLNLLRGAMIALDGMLLSTSVNRLQLPADGDIALPRGRMNIAGTTAIPIDHPDDQRVEDREIVLIRERVLQMLPGLRESTARHSWSGVRPIVYSLPGDRRLDKSVHQWSRDFTVIDHFARDGMAGLFTVVGGKLTTFRLMAEKGADAACRILGVRSVCRTSETVLP
jgi:glycerol-3-phosphate dehydrogenase